jgi:hypothetical protein
MTGFVPGAHGQVRVFPQPENAQSLEGGALQVDVFLGVLRHAWRIWTVDIPAFFGPSCLSILFSIGRP